MNAQASCGTPTLNVIEQLAWVCKLGQIVLFISMINLFWCLFLIDQIVRVQLSHGYNSALFWVDSKYNLTSENMESLTCPLDQ